MDRRTLLRAGGTLAVAALAGCTGDTAGGGGAATTTGTTRVTDTETTGATGTAGQGATATGTGGGTTAAGAAGDRPALRSQSFEFVSGRCGTRGGSATVTTGDAAVTVEGTATGRNGCTEAVLRGAGYEADGFRVRVGVASTDGTACKQCITDLRYRATFEFAGGVPASVAVLHGEEVVTRA